jgi:hypothetical protein
MAINLNNIYNQTQQRSDSPKRKVGNRTLTNFDESNPTTTITPVGYAPNSYSRGSYTADTGTVVNNPNQPTLPENASMGEATRFLYDTRLQNVFNDYQQSIASLEQSKQTDLQEAYYIRELSKKYLGEYASNVGIGDVSGNLLDIYGSYQKNVMSIQQQSEKMKLDLQQTFDEKSRAAFEGAIESQLQAEQIQLDENSTTALFNVTQGNTGGQEWNVYLQSQLDSGAITEKAYQVLFSKVYQAKINEMQENLDRNFFGYKTDAEGNRVMMTKEEYIDANKSWLNSTDLQKLKDYALIQTTGGLTIKTVDKFEWFDTFSFGGDGFSFEVTDEDGNVISYATAKGDVENDPDANIQVTTEELTEAFESQEGAGLLIAGQTSFEYKGNFYYYTESALKGGTWYRAINYTATAEMYDAMKSESLTNLQKWDVGSNATLLTKYFNFDKASKTLTLTNDSKAQLTYASKAQFSNDGQKISRWLTTSEYPTESQKELSAIQQEFVRVHGGGWNDGTTQSTAGPKNGFNSLKNKIIFFQGSFYYTDNDGAVRKFVRK